MDETAASAGLPQTRPLRSSLAQEQPKPRSGLRKLRNTALLVIAALVVVLGRADQLLHRGR